MTATFILPTQALPHFEFVHEQLVEPSTIPAGSARLRRSRWYQKAFVFFLILGIKGGLLAALMLFLQKPETVLVIKPILIKSLSEQATPPEPIAAPIVSIVTPQITLPEVPQLNVAVTPPNAITVPPANAAPSPPAPAQDSALVSEEESLYYRRIQQLLNQTNIYPRAAKLAKQQGVVEVAFVIARDGTLLSCQVTRSSGYPALDAAALTALRRISPFPPIPASLTAQQVALSLPIEYSLTM
ncbi:MAG TPA: TonB family protein [Cellvibrionaceae bacterium]